jgi:hypothetical protein
VTTDSVTAPPPCVGGWLVESFPQPARNTVRATAAARTIRPKGRSEGCGAGTKAVCTGHRTAWEGRDFGIPSTRGVRAGFGSLEGGGGRKRRCPLSTPNITTPVSASSVRAVFVADKIKWDQAGAPPYLDEIVAATGRSLEAGAFCWLDYLFTRRSDR